jgi:Response regulator
MTGKPALVSVVDDDESVRESLPDLVAGTRFRGQGVPIRRGLSRIRCLSETSCLLLDIAMPGMSGPDLQQELTRRRQLVPIVFITALGDTTLRPSLLAGGAVECLFKPFSESALFDAITAALR